MGGSTGTTIVTRRAGPTRRISSPRSSGAAYLRPWRGCTGRSGRDLAAERFSVSPQPDHAAVEGGAIARRLGHQGMQSINVAVLHPWFFVSAAPAPTPDSWRRPHNPVRRLGPWRPRCRAPCPQWLHVRRRSLVTVGARRAASVFGSRRRRRRRAACRRGENPSCASRRGGAPASPLGSAPRLLIERRPLLPLRAAVITGRRLGTRSLAPLPPPGHHARVNRLLA